MSDRDLWNKLRQLLDSRGARELLHPPARVRPQDYDRVFRRVVRRMRPEAARLALARNAVEDRYQGFENLPAGRRRTVLQSSGPQMLVALAQDLVLRSYAARFDDVRDSLRLATQAVEVVEHIGRRDYLSPPALADLEAEALAYLGNAQRIASKLPPAEKTFDQAEKRREAGTGDRALRADLLMLRAYLQNARGQSGAAARLQDRQIALRRLLGDPARLGVALIDRGFTACWDEGPTERACAFMKEGTELVDDYQPMLAALLGLAEAFARAGSGGDALIALGTAPMLIMLVNSETFETSHSWIQALAFRALGDQAWAARRLEEVRVALNQQGRTRLAAVAALDLLAVYVELGRYREAQALGAEASLTFQNEGLGHAGTAALAMLADAVRKETASGAVAVAIANFIARYQHNRHARLELPDE